MPEIGGPHLPAPIQLLLLCLRSRWDTAALPAARELARDAELDPHDLLRAAHAEGLAPLLYHTVRGREILPSPAEAELRHLYYANAGYNIRLFHEVADVLRRYARDNLAVILLKGAALAHTVYDSLGARPMGDIDLLVHQEDLSRALGILVESGYVPVQAELRSGVTASHENAWMLRRPGKVETRIELHWSLLDSPYYQHRLPMAWFWQTARPLAVGESSALTLGPEAQILYLCAHQVLHHGHEAPAPRLLWLHDVAEVIVRSTGQIDWNLVLRQAQSCDLVLPLQQTLPRLAQEWQIPMPGVIERLGRLRPSPGETHVHARLTAGQRSAAQRFWDDLTSIPKWPKRLHFAWVNLFPASAYMRQRYRIAHPLLLPLYYAYRWYLGIRGALSPGA